MSKIYDRYLTTIKYYTISQKNNLDIETWNIIHREKCTFTKRIQYFLLLNKSINNSIHLQLFVCAFFLIAATSSEVTLDSLVFPLSLINLLSSWPSSLNCTLSSEKNQQRSNISNINLRNKGTDRQDCKRLENR